MLCSRFLSTAVAVAAVFPLAAAQPGQPSDPTPTPSATSLAELGGRVALDRSGLGTADGVLVISNSNLPELAARGLLTSAMGEGSAAPTPAATPAVADAGERARRQLWRSRVRAQRERVARLQEQLGQLEADLASLERAVSTASARQEVTLKPKLEKARQRREATAARLERERSELDAVIRSARADGAEPGWFR
jgi:hypothetical protein